MECSPILKRDLETRSFQRVLNYDVKETLFVPFTIVKFKHLVIQRVVLLDGLSSIKSESTGRTKDDKKKGHLASSKTWETTHYWIGMKIDKKNTELKLIPRNWISIGNNTFSRWASEYIYFQSTLLIVTILKSFFEKEVLDWLIDFKTAKTKINKKN